MARLNEQQRRQLKKAIELNTRERAKFLGMSQKDVSDLSERAQRNLLQAQVVRSVPLPVQPARFFGKVAGVKVKKASEAEIISQKFDPRRIARESRVEQIRTARTIPQTSVKEEEIIQSAINQSRIESLPADLRREAIKRQATQTGQIGGKVFRQLTQEEILKNKLLPDSRAIEIESQTKAREVKSEAIKRLSKGEGKTSDILVAQRPITAPDKPLPFVVPQQKDFFERVKKIEDINDTLRGLAQEERNPTPLAEKFTLPTEEVTGGLNPPTLEIATTPPTALGAVTELKQFFGVKARQESPFDLFFRGGELGLTAVESGAVRIRGLGESAQELFGQAKVQALEKGPKLLSTFERASGQFSQRLGSLSDREEVRVNALSNLFDVKEKVAEDIQKKTKTVKKTLTPAVRDFQKASGQFSQRFGSLQDREEVRVNALGNFFDVKEKVKEDVLKKGTPPVKLFEELAVKPVVEGIKDPQKGAELAGIIGAEVITDLVISAPFTALKGRKIAQILDVPDDLRFFVKTKTSTRKPFKVSTSVRRAGRIEEVVKTARKIQTVERKASGFKEITKIFPEGDLVQTTTKRVGSKTFKIIKTINPKAQTFDIKILNDRTKKVILNQKGLSLSSAEAQRLLPSSLGEGTLDIDTALTRRQFGEANIAEALKVKQKVAGSPSLDDPRFFAVEAELTSGLFQKVEPKGLVKIQESALDDIVELKPLDDFIKDIERGKPVSLKPVSQEFKEATIKIGEGEDFFGDLLLGKGSKPELTKSILQPDVKTTAILEQDINLRGFISKKPVKTKKLSLNAGSELDSFVSGGFDEVLAPIGKKKISKKGKVKSSSNLKQFFAKSKLEKDFINVKKFKSESKFNLKNPLVPFKTKVKGKLKPLALTTPVTKKKLTGSLKKETFFDTSNVLGKDISTDKSILNLKVTSPNLKTLSDTDIFTKSGLFKATEDIQIQKELPKLDTDLDFFQVSSSKPVKSRKVLPRTTTAPITAQIIPDIELPSLGAKEVKKKGYDVFVKSKGKFKRLNKAPLTKKSALDYSNFLVDNSAARTFLQPKKTKLKGKTLEIDFAGRFEPRKYTKKGKRYIEKSKFAIDSLGELQGITAKGLAKLNARRFIRKVSPRKAKVAPKKKRSKSKGKSLGNFFSGGIRL